MDRSNAEHQQYKSMPKFVDVELAELGEATKIESSVSEKVTSEVPVSDDVALRIFGFDISHVDERILLAFLTFFSLGSALGFSYLQEKVFRVEGFKFHGFMTFLTSVTYTVCGIVELFVTGDLKRKAPWFDYFLLSIFTLGGMYCTNWSLSYLNYTTRIIFKSSKVIPVMIIYFILVKKK